MRYSKLSLLVPCTLPLSACTTVTPVYKDNGIRSGSCIEGGPDSAVQQFYDYYTQHRNSDITAPRPCLSDNLVKLLADISCDSTHHNLFSSDSLFSRATSSDSASVANASTTPNGDAHNIPLRAELKQGDQSWRDEVPMTREGQCWVVDDVCYLGGSIRTSAGTLRQSVEDH